MKKPEAFDILIIGAGSAGFAAARVAAGEAGAKAALVEQGPVGGLCILAGCMPSKMLIQSSNMARLAGRMERFGLKIGTVHPDFQAIMKRKDEFIAELAAVRRRQMEELPGIELMAGRAVFRGPDTVRVGDRLLQAPRIILAVGSSPLVPTVPGLADIGFLLSEEVLKLSEQPASMIVIGGGMIALELGQFYARLGTEVTILEVGPRLLGREDEDVSAVIADCLRREGLKIHTGARVVRAERQGRLKCLYYETDEGRQMVRAEEILVAVGREPAIADMELERAGIALEGRGLVLDRCLRTTNPAIFAAGDCTGGAYMVHVAVAEGELAARNALLGCAPTPAPEHLYISVAFTEPNIARVGFSETEAAGLGYRILVGRTDFTDHGKARIMDRHDGFIKVLADAGSGQILGAVIVGPEGAELIHEYACAIAMRATVEQYLTVPHVHPTLAEMLPDPVEDILNLMRSGRPSVRIPSGYNDR